jgi:RNA polymerase sigma-70 factor, ECF subfamily
MARGYAIMSEPLETIYEQERPAIFAYLLRRCGNWHIAEDITSEVFLAAYEARERWEDRGVPYHNFLMRVAHWRYNLYWKKEKRWYRHMDYHPSLEQHAYDGSAVAPDDILDKCHTAMSYAILEAALGKLRPRQAKAIALRYGRALPEKEAARQMGLGYEAYHALHRNALARLSDIMLGKPKEQVRHRSDATIPETCQEDGCDRPHYARNKCRRHWKAEYRRLRRENAVRHDRQV